MKTIWKFELTLHGAIEMPDGANILTVQEQRGVPCIWAEVDTNAPMVKRHFDIYGTGHEMKVDMGVERKYIGTFQIQGGALVFHVFERLN